MKIGVVQMQSLHADIEGNITRHEQFVRQAVSENVDMLVFPELSLTQYDAPNAHEVAISADDPRLSPLQNLSDETQMMICAGTPLNTEKGNVIAMLIFQPEQAMQVYEKHYLHDDELPFFASGTIKPSFTGIPKNLAFAVCYEISVPQHVEDAHEQGASIYVASVAKTHTGVQKATERLSTISRDFGMSVLLSNCIGPCDGSIGGGQSAVWNANGERIAHMDDTQEGIIIYDPDSPDIAPKIVIVQSSALA